ncbi:MAG: hypothetical protein K940chlam9_00023 [Chlamydiae bacterium]|nr:hypothetical protein [Chlamydiota bacterium]
MSYQESFNTYSSPFNEQATYAPPPAYLQQGSDNYSQYRDNHSPSSPYSSGIHSRGQKPGVCSPMTRVIVSIALITFTAIAAYFCFSSGFNRLDLAWRGMDRFVGGALVYMGLAFATAATVNAVYALYKTVFSHKNYTAEEARIQIALTAFAPLAFIPAALCSGVAAAAR